MAAREHGPPCAAIRPVLHRHSACTRRHPRRVHGDRNRAGNWFGLEAGHGCEKRLDLAACPCPETADVAHSAGRLRRPAARLDRSRYIALPSVEDGKLHLPSETSLYVAA